LNGLCHWLNRCNLPNIQFCLNPSILWQHSCHHHHNLVGKWKKKLQCWRKNKILFIAFYCIPSLKVLQKMLWSEDIWCLLYPGKSIFIMCYKCKNKKSNRPMMNPMETTTTATPTIIDMEILEATNFQKKRIYHLPFWYNCKNGLVMIWFWILLCKDLLHIYWIWLIAQCQIQSFATECNICHIHPWILNGIF